MTLILQRDLDMATMNRRAKYDDRGSFRSESHRSDTHTLTHTTNRLLYLDYKVIGYKYVNGPMFKKKHLKIYLKTVLRFFELRQYRKIILLNVYSRSLKSGTEIFLCIR